MADGRMVAIIVTQNSNTAAIYYPILDHLGSVSAIVDGNRLIPGTQTINANWGKVIDRYSFDAWGEARDPAQWTPRTCADNPQAPFTRGFAGQEHIPGSVCLVNMNARIYNPEIGRFFSADPTVEAPYNPQDLNRYSYVLNDPLVFTDPSGLYFLGCFWTQSWFAPVLDIALVFVGLPWLETLTPFLTASGTGLFAAFDAEGTALLAANAGIAGGISGYAATGKIGGALISAGSAAAFAGLVPGIGNGIGSALGGGTYANAAGYFVAGGMVGGLTSVINHQNFASGFLSGGVGSPAGPLFGPAPSIQGAIASSVLGGFASVLGGGKFANGALTAAFAYAAAICASARCIGGSVENAIDGGSSASASQQNEPGGTPDKLVILGSENHGNFSFYYYQLEDANGTPLTGDGYAMEEDVVPDLGQTSDGQYVPMTNGTARDVVGWANQDANGNYYQGPPDSTDEDVITTQTFSVKYQGDIFPLSTEFIHFNVVIDGIVTNNVAVVKP